MEAKRVMVIGAGQMGSGIAQVCAQAGYDVIMHDVKEEAAKKGLERMNRLLQGNVEKGRLTEEEMTETLQRTALTSELQEAREADVVIAAVVEDIEVNTKVVQELDNIVPAHGILASNTSSLP